MNIPNKEIKKLVLHAAKNPKDEISISIFKVLDYIDSLQEKKTEKKQKN